MRLIEALTHPISIFNLWFKERSIGPILVCNFELLPIGDPRPLEFLACLVPSFNPWLVELFAPYINL